jgi:hypothetical protein
MSDLLQRMSNEHKGPIEGLLRRLPGFKGYEEMQDRRTADTQMRNELARLLKEQLSLLGQAEKAVLNGGGLSYMSKMKDTHSKLQLFIDRIVAAMPGYAGFFASVKVGPNELQQLYTFDADLFDFVDKIREKVAAVQTAGNDKTALDKAIADLDTLMVNANNTFNQRDNVIRKMP